MTTLHSRRRRSARRRSTSRRQQTYQATAQAGLETTAWAPPSALRRAPSLLLAAASLALLLYFFVGESFYVADVQAQGNALLTSQELLQASGVRGWSSFYVNERQVAERLEAAFPAIRSVRVRCRLPNRVKLIVDERAPQVVWEAANGRYLLDAEGMVIKGAESLRDLVLIKDGDRGAAKLRDELDVAEAITTAQALAELLGDTRVFAYTQDKGIILRHTDAAGAEYEVYFGVGPDVAVRFANMQALIKRVQDEGLRNIAYLDVRYNRMAIGFRSP
ncbi:MAG: FtsQ-type POTRA domain-containing protein [Chloroflexi bacterium]|nr:FtsQ-type POTRA domain-containing protein [Chloroflexota bacterium]